MINNSIQGGKVTMKTLKKTLVALAGSSLVLSATMASQAVAHEVGAGGASAGGSRIEQLERELQMLRQELQELKAHSEAHHQQMMELEEWKEQAGTGAFGGAMGNNMVFFRGGYTRYDHDRNSEILPTGGRNAVLPTGLGQNNDQDGWYVGAGFDFGLSKDLFGLTEGTILEGTDLLGEVLFEYRKYSNLKKNGGITPLEAVESAALTGTVQNLSGNSTVSITHLTISASPKIKFLRGHAFRPWIIPVGLGIHVISPPSDGVTVLNPGLVFGAGADYNVWKNLFVGVDARYHLTADEDDLGGIDGTDTDGLTAGGYIGFGF
ncbi:MAG: hypothetical protein AXA67_09705 [Methylothermaceae bacteria B42]|nr:MAG: hypothetical protein AXA67_09705 [Methylothermaceae bacteria B42]